MHWLLRAERPADELDAAVEITSLTFMFDCVPEPVCQTYRGSPCPVAGDHLVADALDQLPFHSGMRPARVLTMAAAFLT